MVTEKRENKKTSTLKEEVKFIERLKDKNINIRNKPDPAHE